MKENASGLALHIDSRADEKLFEIIFVVKFYHLCCKSQFYTQTSFCYMYIKIYNVTMLKGYCTSYP